MPNPWIKLALSSAAQQLKQTLRKNETVQHTLFRAIFFENMIRWLMFQWINVVLSVSEFYFAEILKELFSQLLLEAPNQYLPEVIRKINQRDLRKWKSLLQLKYCWIINERKSIGNSLHKAYNWLTELMLLPSELKSMTKSQVRHHH